MVLTIYDISHKLNINEVIKLMNFNIEFYKDKESKRCYIEEFLDSLEDKESKRCYIEEFLDSLDTKSRVHTLRNIQLLSDFGYSLREPYSKNIDDGIFELRIKQSSNIYRVLYFFYKDKNIILTNGFIKKTNKTPKNEINIAKECKNKYYRSIENERPK